MSGAPDYRSASHLVRGANLPLPLPDRNRGPCAPEAHDRAGKGKGKGMGMGMGMGMGTFWARNRRATASPCGAFR
jgi:hypothetical protein